MKYEIGFVDNPKFESITGLTNTTFDPDNIQEDRMATEAQVLAAWNASVDLEQEVERCCKNMCVWETYVQIVRLNKNTSDTYQLPSTGGIVVSPFHHNRRAGIMRQGGIYTVEFSLPFNGDVYAPYTITADNNGGPGTSPYIPDKNNIKMIQYRITIDNIIECSTDGASVSEDKRRSGFLKFVGYQNSSYINEGFIINNQGDWGNFVRSVGDDGTVSITDSRQREDFTVIRYYTQWTLRECGDGSLLPDPTI